MVLSGIRTDKPIIECEDRDFETAMKLAEVYYAQLFQIRRNLMNFEHQENSGKDWIKVREAYNCLYRENSFQGDYEKYSKS